MRNLIVPLLVLWLCSCSYFADAHERKQAEKNLVQAQANLLNRCSDPRVDGQLACVYPPAWPFTAKVGETPQTQVSLIPPMGSLPLVGGLVGALP